MSSTEVSAAASVAGSVTKAVEAFGLGELTLDEFRSVLHDALVADPAQVDALHELLDDQLVDAALVLAPFDSGAVGWSPDGWNSETSSNGLPASGRATSSSGSARLLSMSSGDALSAGCMEAPFGSTGGSERGNEDGA